MGAKAKTAEEKARNDSAEFKISNQIFKRRVKKTKRSIIQSSKKISWNTETLSAAFSIFPIQLMLGVVMCLERKFALWPFNDLCVLSTT